MVTELLQLGDFSKSNNSGASIIFANTVLFFKMAVAAGVVKKHHKELKREIRERNLPDIRLSINGTYH